MSFINGQGGRWGVEPICRVLEVAPSTYYAAASRQPCARQVRDAALKPEIARVHRDNYAVYGAHKLWRQLNREGFEVGRDRVRRLMTHLQLAGVRRGKVKRTTLPGEVSQRPQDLVERSFVAAAPNRPGSPTSPMSVPGPASSTRPLLSTPSAAESWAGG